MTRSTKTSRKTDLEVYEIYIASAHRSVAKARLYAQAMGWLGAEEDLFSIEYSLVRMGEDAIAGKRPNRSRVDSDRTRT